MSQTTVNAPKNLIARRVASSNLQKGRTQLKAKMKEMKERGLDVVDLSGYVVEQPYGEFASPPQKVKDLVKKAIDSGWPEPLPRGIMSFRNLIAQVEGNVIQNEVDPNKEVLVTGGGSMQALYNAIQATVNPGDEVLMFTPGLPYDEIVRLAEGVPVFIDLRLEDGYRFDSIRIEKAVTPKTKLLIVNTPHNPSGHVLTIDELEGMADIARRHDLVVISDEVLWNWLYDDRKHISIASLSGMKERTVVVNSLTKTGLFDWRVGWAVGPATIIDRLEKLMFWQNQFSPPLLQIASEAHLANLSEWIKPVISEQQRKRDFVHSRLVEMGLPCFKPEGAIMTFPSIRNFTNDSVDFAGFILEHGKVFLNPGVAYLRDGHLRVGYNIGMERIKEGLERAAKAVGQYHPNN
jgi:aspartate/methionine/tyrosine aminotransferase